MTDLPPTPSPNRPRRTKWWFIRCMIVLLVIGTVILAAIMFWRTQKARSEFLAARDALRQQGEPVTPEDVAAMYAIPDADNAAIPLRHAASLVVKLDEDLQREFGSFELTYPLKPRDRELLDMQLVTLDAIENDVRKATNCSGACWQAHFDSPLIDMLYPELKQQPPVADTLNYAALRALDQGNYPEALRHARLIAPIARALRRHPSVDGWLTGVGIDELRMTRIQDVAVRMTVGDKAGSVDPRQIKALLAELLDEKDEVDTCRNALRCDRTEFSQGFERLANRQLPHNEQVTLVGSISIFFKGPSLWSANTNCLARLSPVLQSINAPDWQTARALIPAPLPPEEAGDVGEKMLRQVTQSNGRIVRQHFHSLASHRMTALLLAIRWYASDHQGQFPKTLDELTPGYLPAIPRDPFATGGRPLLYINEGEEPRIYSVGRNGVDDCGSDPYTSPNAYKELPRGQEALDTEDIVVRLKPETRSVTEPATAP